MGFVVKNTTRINILDLIAPFTCRCCGRLGDTFCERCKKYNISACPKICPGCRKSQKMCSCEVPIFTVGYREGVLKRLVEEYKFQSVQRNGIVLAELLDAILPNFLECYGQQEVVVVPLPTISRHIRKRGFDHTKNIAKGLTKIRRLHQKSSELGKRVIYSTEMILTRKCNTVQVGKSSEVRKKQAKNAYGIVKKYEHRLDPAVLYLLLDDIWTTGSSIRAAAEILRKNGAKKIAAATILMGR